MVSMTSHENLPEFAASTMTPDARSNLCAEKHPAVDEEQGVRQMVPLIWCPGYRNGDQPIKLRCSNNHVMTVKPRKAIPPCYAGGRKSPCGSTAYSIVAN